MTEDCDCGSDVTCWSTACIKRVLDQVSATMALRHAGFKQLRIMQKPDADGFIARPNYNRS